MCGCERVNRDRGGQMCRFEIGIGTRILGVDRYLMEDDVEKGAVDCTFLF